MTRRRGWIRQALAWSAGALAGLLAVSALAFQDNLFTYFMNPQKPFQLTEPPPAPDYGAPEAWALRPAAPDPAKAAIFFVHPTTYWGGSDWNAPLDEDVAGERLKTWALPTWAGPFMAAGQVWAPRYRQASLYSALTHRYDARRARAFAYEDVARAFEAFLAAAPEDAPVVIVGVEQGGLHVLGLLQQYDHADALRARLVAAYVIEQATPLDLFGAQLERLAPCAEPDAIRCLASWGAIEEDDGREITRFRARSMTWTAQGRLEATGGRALLCVNPILWTANEDYAPQRTHRGGVDATGLEAGMSPAPLPAQTSAQCRDGVLLIDRPDSATLRRGWGYASRLKPPRANLFYADIRANLEERIAAFRERRAIEERMAPPLDGTVEIDDSPIRVVPE